MSKKVILSDSYSNEQKLEIIQRIDVKSNELDSYRRTLDINKSNLRRRLEEVARLRKSISEGEDNVKRLEKDLAFVKCDAFDLFIGIEEIK